MPENNRTTPTSPKKSLPVSQSKIVKSPRSSPGTDQADQTSDPPPLHRACPQAFSLVWWTHIATLFGNWDAAKQRTGELAKLFFTIPKPPNMTLNTLSFCFFINILFYFGGVSAEFLWRALIFIFSPLCFGSLAYQYYRFGSQILDLTPAVAYHWLHNWFVMFSMALVSWTQEFLVAVILEVLQPHLPYPLTGYLTFSTSELEQSVLYSALICYLGTVICLCFSSAWVKGYHMNRNLVDREGDLTWWEAVGEVLYHGVNQPTHFLWQVSLANFLQHYGFKFHVAALALELLCGVTTSYSLQLKLGWMHRLSHEIRPLNNMIHIEHHITKGIYPCTAGQGQWETFFYGGCAFFSMVPGIVPYFPLQIVCIGGNIVPHLMAPHKALAQWHTLHHVITADIYAGNIPTARDKATSRSFKKYKSKIDDISLFTKYTLMTDLVTFMIMAVISVILYFCFGGIGVIPALISDPVLYQKLWIMFPYFALASGFYFASMLPEFRLL